MFKLKLPLGFLALVVAALLAFAFSPLSKAVASSPNANVWVKYDCAVNGQVSILAGGNTSSSGYPVCNADGNICAQLFNTAQLDAVPGHPGNFTPKSGATVLQTVRCP